MLIDHLKFLWAEAIACTTYLYNHLPHRRIENTFRIEMLDSIDPPPVYHLHSFGCKAYIHISDEARPASSKLQPRAVEETFVRYTPSFKIFRTYLPDKQSIYHSRQVFFSPYTTGEVTLSIDLSVPRNAELSIDLINNKDLVFVFEQLIQEQA
jgi:hypothetical protein